MRDEFLVVGVVCFSSSLSWLILWICFCQRKALGSGFWLRWHLPQQCWPGDHDHICQKGFVLQKTSRKYLHCPFRYPKAIWNEIKNRNSQVDSYNMWGVRKIPWRRETLPTPVFWPRQFLGVYSPWGRQESDKIGWLNNNSNEVSPFVKQRNQQYLQDCACSGAHSCPTLCRPVACSSQDPLSVEFFRQEYWNGLPFPPPGNLPHPGTEPRSPAFHNLHWLAGSFLLNRLGNSSLRHWVILKYFT